MNKGEVNNDTSAVEKLDIEDYRFDFRLLDVTLELSALEDHLELIEKQIRSLEISERTELDERIRSMNADSEEWERDAEYQQFYHNVDFLFPRLFRGPFLVSLYAVYESAVTEIARLIQQKSTKSLSIKDIRGNGFLDRAKKYYQHILGFELCREAEIWERIAVLAELRHALAHTNGRLEMLTQKAKEKISVLEKQKIGVETISGYIVVDSDFLRKTYSSVRQSLEDLIERYKQFDDSSGPDRN